MKNKALAIFFMLFLTASLFSQTKPLRAAVFLLEPFMMTDPEHQEVTGAVIDYWQEFLAPRMNREIEVVGLFPILRLEKMLESGEIDIAPLFTKIPTREERFLYPETPLSEIISCLIVLPDSPIQEAKTTEDLKNTRIGFIEGGYIPPMLKDPSITIELVSSEDYRKINLNKLFAGRIDALLDINYISLQYYLKEGGLTDRVRIVLLPTETVYIYSIFRKTREGEQLRREFDQANREGLRLGIFKSILARYID